MVGSVAHPEAGSGEEDVNVRMEILMDKEKENELTTELAVLTKTGFRRAIIF